MIWMVLATLSFAGDLEDTLLMESPGWQFAGAARGDDDVFRGGERSIRLERTANQPIPTASIWMDLPIRVAGKRVELRGWARADQVDEGRVGLFLRVADGAKTYAKKARYARNGRAGWQELRIRVPLDADGRKLFLGASLEGVGKAWVDDLELLVDGRPLADAPPRPELVTAYETDHEFDGGSGIALDAVSPAQADHLVRLAKVWGFLKAHHPGMRSGQIHADYALFRVVPDVLAASDSAAADAVILGWIDRMGPVPACDPCAEPTRDAHLSPPLDWMQGPGALDLRLREIHAARPADRRHYLVSMAMAGNIGLPGEPAYAELEELDSGYRLLSVFRFWNVIEWWFPYRDLVVGDRDEVLRRGIVGVVAAEDRTGVAEALLRMHVAVADTHSNLWGWLDHRPPIADCMLEAEFRFIGDALVVWKPGAGLARGDVVEAIDGVAVGDLVDDWAPLYAASNEPTRMRDIGRNMMRGPCGAGTVTVAAEGGPRDVTVERAERRMFGFTHDRPGDTFQMLDDDVAYLKLSSVRLADIGSYLDRAEGTRGWVLDLRNYPSDFVLYALGQHMVDDKTPFARFTTPDMRNPGAFRWGKAAELKPAKPRYEGRVAVLVDEVTQSSAEFHAMAFRAAGARVFGSTTAGADGNVSRIPLPGGTRSMISGIGVFYPDRTPTQQIGIVPDVEVIPTVAGIAAGRDEVLDAALEWIRE